MSAQKKKPYCIIGYSLDSAYLARQLANSGYPVEHYMTGDPAHPFDQVGEHFSNEDCVKIRAVGVEAEYEVMNDSTYVFVPYAELTMVNSRNGLISYPLNRDSFESAEEREQMEGLISRLGEFHAKIKDSTNPMNEYRAFFPKWLHDSLLKHLGINKWAGIRQNKLTIPSLAKEINISALDGSGTGKVYRPTAGFADLCNRLLDHPNVTKGILPVSRLNQIITKPNRNCTVVVMDNRVDMACKYAQGVFDRVEWTVEEVHEPIVEEFIDVDDAIVFTPHKDYWCTTNHRGKVSRVRSRLVDDIQYAGQTVLAPTNNNQKLYAAYKKLMGLYSNKVLKLGNNFYTAIL